MRIQDPCICLSLSYCWPRQGDPELGSDPGRDSNPSEVSSGAGGCGEDGEVDGADEDSGSLASGGVQMGALI